MYLCSPVSNVTSVRHFFPSQSADDVVLERAEKQLREYSQAWFPVMSYLLLAGVKKYIFPCSVLSSSCGRYDRRLVVDRLIYFVIAGVLF